MKPEESPFGTAWWMAGFYGYRDCLATYCRFDYDQLPPLNYPTLDGSFDWLTLEDSLLEKMAPYYDPENADSIRYEFPIWQAFLADKGITLPESFRNLMQSPERLQLIPSCTACYFDIIPPIPSPLGDDAWILTFLFDQQVVVTWSLYLVPGGDHGVVVESAALAAWERGDAYVPPDPDTYRKGSWLVGEDFESFLYRFWFENRLWFKITDEWPLSAEEKAYLDSYTASQ